MRELRLCLLMALVFAGGCERVTAPVVARPPRPLIPAVEVSVRRFDTLEWPLAKRRIQLPQPNILEKVAQLLRFPKDTGHGVTGIEIRDTTAWAAFWSKVAVGDSIRPPPPLVDFSRDMVYVVVAEPRGDWAIGRFAIDHVYRIESRYSVHTTITHARQTDTLRLVDAVVIPALPLRVTLFLTS